MALRIDREWTPALIRFIQSLTEETAAAGRRLAEARGVLRLSHHIERKRLGGRVGETGRPVSKPALALEAGQSSAECDCGETAPCVHAAATALTVLGEAFRRGSTFRRDIKPLLPHAWRLGATLLSPTLFKPIDAFFELDKAQPAAPEPPAPAALPKPAPAGARPALAAPAPPAPPEGPAPAEGPPIKVVVSLAGGPGDGFPVPVWRLMLRTGDAPARACTAREIKQLGRELGQKRGSKWQAARCLVEWVLEVSGMHPATTLAAGGAVTFVVRNLTRWLISLEGSGLLRWEDGVGIRTGRGALAPALLAGAEGGPVWGLAAVRGDGSPESAGLRAPLAETPLFIDPAQPGTFFAVRAGAVHPVILGELQPAELLAMRAAGLARASLFADPARAARQVGRMAEAWLKREAPEAWTPWVELAAARPVVELRHKRGCWIWLAVYARSGAGHVFMREDRGRWQHVADPAVARRWSARSPYEESDPLEPLGTGSPEGAGEAAAEGGAGAGSWPAGPLAVLPRPEALEPLDAWLARLIPLEALPQPGGEGRIAYQWPSGEAAIAALRREWARRPAVADYYGNNAFQRLIDQRRRPPLRVETESGGLDWLWVSAELEAELAGLTADAVARLLGETRDRLIRLPDGRAYQREGLEELLEELRALEELGVRPGAGRRRLHALQLAGNPARRALGGGALAGLEEQLRGLAQRFAGIPAAPVDEALAGRLRPYQRAGADFLAWAGQALGGALLADDMGLGKTVQALAALTALRRVAEAPLPALVVCPASVAHNWRREAERFCPGLRVLVLESGAGRALHLRGLGQWDLVIANYALARRDAAALARVKWLMVCADEAQAIKNPRSETAAAVRALPAHHRFALTGTPVENRLADLVSIMDFAVPGHLDGVREEVSNGAEEGAPGAVRCLRARLRPVLLRRLKGEVAPELPERIEERIDCAMGDGQRRLYLAEVARARQALGGWSAAEGQTRMHVFAALTRLRQLCCEPALLGHPEAGSAKVDELLELLSTLIDEGHKTLVFSSFTTVLDLLEGRLAPLGAPVYKLTGQTPPAARQGLVDRFEKETRPAVFLISLKAGGTGLNLVSASHVVIFDPWWNPAAEAQAIDRTHRIGQDKTVVALRLVTLGTLEERIMALQEKKRGLAQAVLGEDGFGAALTREEIEFLLDGD